MSETDAHFSEGVRRNARTNWDLLKNRPKQTQENKD